MVEARFCTGVVLPRHCRYATLVAEQGDSNLFGLDSAAVVGPDGNGEVDPGDGMRPGARAVDGGIAK